MVTKNARSIEHPLPINSDLVWDYDIPPAAEQSEAFRRWYISRVLTRGRAKDLKAVGLATIAHYLPGIHLPMEVQRFWEWYSSLGPQESRAYVLPGKLNKFRSFEFTAYQGSDKTMDILTPLQRQTLLAIGQTPLSQSFYLTGGTALAAFYLYHRYSVDLDFFTPDPTAIGQVPMLMQAIAQQLGVEITFTRTLNTFLECFLHRPDGEQVEMDFAQDTPYRLEPTHFDPTLQINVDNLTDIACNKLSALFDRAEAKDFVDVYFLCQEHFPFEHLTELARQKHVGLDDYWLAVALRRVETVEFLPRMIKPLSLEELKAFFLDQARRLMEGIAKE